MASGLPQPDWPAGWLRERLGYVSLDPSLFEAALTHRSASGRNNERLEFLGDAVLNLVAADQLYRLFPMASEGDLSRLRARVVSAEPLGAIALELGLGEALQLGSGELKTGGFRRQSILSDALEAVIGAIYLDRGMEAAREIVQRMLEPRIAAAPDPADCRCRPPTPPRRRRAGCSPARWWPSAPTPPTGPTAAAAPAVPRARRTA